MDARNNLENEPMPEGISEFIRANRLELMADPELAKRQMDRFLGRLATLTEWEREALRGAVLGPIVAPR
jgi:hypothetical protein